MTDREKIVEIGAQGAAIAWGEQWECNCRENKGLNCDCDCALSDDRASIYDEESCRNDYRGIVKAALKALEEAGIQLLTSEEVECLKQDSFDLGARQGR